MDWLKKHVGAFIIIGTILPALLWSHTEIDKRFEKIDERLTKVEQDLVIIKIVLISKDIMSIELAKKKGK